MTLQRINKMIDQEYTGAVDARLSTVEGTVAYLEASQNQIANKFEWRYNPATNALELVVL